MNDQIDNSRLIIEIFCQFPSHIRELLIGQAEADNFTLFQLISLGDRIIKLSAALGCAEYKSEKNITEKFPKDNNLDTLICSLFTEQHGLSQGASFCIIKEFRKENFKSSPVSLFAIEEDVISSWMSLRAEIRKAKRAKQLFLLGSKTKELATKLLDNFYKIVFNKRASVTEEFLNYPDVFLDNDFIIHSECSECKGKHIFVFDSFSISEGDFEYCNWGLLHTRHVSAKTTVGAKLKRKYWEETQLETSQVNLFPLFSDSYSAMQKLANLIFEQTTQKTKEGIWLKNDKDKDTKIDMQSLILLDCITRSPIEVLREVALKEGLYDKERSADEGELEHYIKILAKATMSEKDAEEYIFKVQRTIDATIKEKVIDPKDYLGKLLIEHEIQAYEVAKLLGFPVKRYNEVCCLDYYKNSLKELASDAADVAGDIQERGLMNKAFSIFENVLTDLCMFYSYLTYCVLQQSLSKNDWKKKMEGIKGLSLGNKYHLLLKINTESKSLSDRLKLLIGQTQYFNADKFNKLSRNGSSEFIITLRNNFSHERYEEIKGKAQRIVEIVNEFIDFIGDENRRIFPYKIYITILTRTSHGIRTCQYITNLSESVGKHKTDKNNQGKKTIYTEKEIDFQKVYYCLPNPKKCGKNIWVEPLLIPIDDVLCDD